MLLFFVKQINEIGFHYFNHNCFNEFCKEWHFKYWLCIRVSFKPWTYIYIDCIFIWIVCGRQNMTFNERCSRNKYEWLVMVAADTWTWDLDIGGVDPTHRLFFFKVRVLVLFDKTSEKRRKQSPFP